ncbi:phytanoyl-CoA dioxygenase [Angomonas deanei]|uniref:Phytanoyl-CoA dioxygenase (PhyH) n=1 Tax=Angomonas deanei TaxID=59799 RepID=A0A7G2CQ10_9TRYP|nr:phytanoyl-CoA dioxygenase [Angomonas deanei]CAD2221054.1 hypothetical protein, conserved [Angomonas deanei]|eukprot:EPY24703.1 phytanoyl-CoA dioxygenase [Angomonas deanei]
MFRQCVRRLHGRLTYPVGQSKLAVAEDLLPIIPSNDIFYDPPKLRARLDETGYLYFQNVIPSDVVNNALEDLASQMIACQWTLEEDRKRLVDLNGFSYGVPFPHLAHHADVELPPPSIEFTDTIRAAVSGTSAMSVVRQVFGGKVNAMDLHSLQMGSPGESFGFKTPSVLLNKGTKLALVALVPLQDTPMCMGPPVVVRGSNRTDGYSKIRKTYGQWEVESGNIASTDGCYTHRAEELSPLGKQMGTDPVTGRSIVIDENPFVSCAMGAGDILLLTVYSMYSYLTNQTNYWRMFGEAVWIMDGDDVGPDPRYMGTNAPGLAGWYDSCTDPTKHPLTIEAAKKEWGLLGNLEEVKTTDEAPKSEKKE